MAARSAARLLLFAASLTRRLQALAPSSSYSQLGARAATVVSEDSITPAGAEASRKYLIASFPNLRQVAYCHLPDNVWRPLVIGEIASPRGVAVDEQNARLFIADPPNNVIWWYKLSTRHNGLLQTVGSRHAAVEGYSAQWLAVNGVGDLYFTGHQVTGASQPTYDSVFRQDAIGIATGNSLSPTEIYARANTGNPNAKAWMPSGIAVDSFYVYWGNQEQGRVHGSVVKGSRTNIGSLSQESLLHVMSSALEEVRGVAATGTHVFCLSPVGVHGMAKSAATTLLDPGQGLVASPPSGEAARPWEPAAIAWDGDNSLYLTDAGGGLVYSLPAQNAMGHSLTKFADAPNVYALAVMDFHSAGASALGSFGLLPASAALLAILPGLLC